MKKSTLFILPLALFGSAFAQNRATLPNSISTVKATSGKSFSGNESQQLSNPSATPSTAEAGQFAEEIVGDTKYDLQTNSSICNIAILLEANFSIVFKEMIKRVYNLR